jgi:hypothetical protein
VGGWEVLVLHGSEDGSEALAQPSVSEPMALFRLTALEVNENNETFLDPSGQAKVAAMLTSIHALSEDQR